MGTIEKKLCGAIRGRLLVAFNYKDTVHRLVEPHLIGENLAGRSALVGWQVAEPAERSGWRTFLLNDIRDLQVTATTFQVPRSGFNPSDPNMRTVYCTLL